MFSGNFPWEHAQESDVYYKEYIQWHRHYQIQRRFKLPSQWYRFSNRLMRLFRKMLGKYYAMTIFVFFIELVYTLYSDPEPSKRCEMIEISKYYDDRWINDQFNYRRRSSNEDEGVEEDFSSSGSGTDSNTATTSNTDFEELTQMMRNSLIGFDNLMSIENQQSSATARTYC